MISGKKIGLRAVEIEDLPQLQEWRNKPEFRKHYREYRELNLGNQQQWYEKTVLNDKNTLMFSIIDLETGNLIGCCGLCYINWVQRNAELSIYIGYNDIYIDPDGYAYETCQLLFDYGFNELNLHKIWSEIYEFDVRKIQIYNKFGFNKDAVLREHYFHEGKWWDSTIWSLLQREFNK